MNLLSIFNNQAFEVLQLQSEHDQILNDIIEAEMDRMNTSDPQDQLYLTDIRNELLRELESNNIRLTSANLVLEKVRNELVSMGIEPPEIEDMLE